MKPAKFKLLVAETALERSGLAPAAFCPRWTLRR